jgi:hypothetical protein
MTKRHTISINDFQDYIVRQELAAGDGKKLILIFDPLTNEALYRVERNRVVSGFATIEEAIEAYNDL